MLPSEAGAAAQTVEMLITEIKAIAGGTLEELKSSASDSTQSFRTMAVPAGAFGDVPLAQRVAQQHAAAHDVFVSTIDGVIADLEDFQSKLLASATAHERTDDAAYLALVKLGRDYRDHSYHSDENWNEGRGEHRDELAVAEDHGADGGGDGPGADAGAEGAGGSGQGDTGSEHGFS